MSRLVNIGLRKRSKSAKFGCYDSALGLLDDIQDNFNMLNDLQVIDNVKKAEFDMMIEGIERQLSGLLNSLDKSRKERIGVQQQQRLDFQRYQRQSEQQQQDER